MKSMKHYAAMLLAACVAVTSVPVGNIPVNAEILPETMQLSQGLSVSDELIAGSDFEIAKTDGKLNNILAEDSISGTGIDIEAEYTEGDVIVCVNESYSGSHSSNASDAKEVTDQEAAAAMNTALSLLDGAEELMDVTQAVNESDLITDVDAGTGISEKDNSLNGKNISGDARLPGDDDEYSLKYIHSDIYTTEQLIEMLEAMPEVLFAEPNYIYHLADDETIEEENEPVPELSIADPTDVKLADDGSINGENMPDRLIADRTDRIPETALLVEENDSNIISDTEEVHTEKAENSDNNISLREAGRTNTKPDLSGHQYAYGNSGGGIDVPDWNNSDKKNVSANTVVAIMDSGVDYNHEDLNIWDDGLKYPELTALGGGKYGYNGLIYKSTGERYTSYDPMDDYGHGTHCAGIVGAQWNGYGVSGTANSAELMAVKIINDGDFSDESVILRGFNYIKTAKEAGVNVVAVNNSWHTMIESASEMLAVRELTTDNIVCCFASGNNSENHDLSLYRTTSILRENDGAIAVNSNDSEGKISWFSNYGIRLTDVSAPGTEIMSTIPTGTGEADPDMCEPVRDVSGNPAIEDFNSEETYFYYTPNDGASKEICEDRGQNVLKISNISEGSFFMYIDCGELEEVPKYFAMCSRFEDPFSLAVVAYVALDNGEWAECYPRVYENTEYRSENLYELPENMDIENPEIVLQAIELMDSEGRNFYIRGLSFIKERASYGYMSGTSMATPAVTGEVAVLASEWPGDCAGRRAARVIGSTQYRDDLNGTSRTDGIVNVRKALDCDYSPVINKAWIDNNGLINVSGYFFGKEGSVSIVSGEGDIGGLSVDSWNGQSREEWNEDGNNTEDVIRLDPGAYKYNGDELLITVTTSEGRSGSRILTVSNASAEEKNRVFYEELALPVDDIAFNRTEFFASTALDGAIYYAGKENEEDQADLVLWKCMLSEEGATAVWEKTDHGVSLSTVSNICAWNKMLVYIGDDDHIKLYSPDKGLVYDSSIVIPYDGNNEVIQTINLINAEGDLYFLKTSYDLNIQTEQLENYRSELYSVDIEKQSLKKLYTLESIKYDPVVFVSEGEPEESNTIYFLDSKGDNVVSVEALTINGDSLSSTVKEVKLPDNCHNDSYKLAGSANQYGIVLAGPLDHTDGSDNFLYLVNDGTLIKCGRQIAPVRPHHVLVTEYKGRTYFLCLDMYSEYARTFAYCDDEDFRGSSEHRNPLPCYGDEETGGIGKISTEISLTAVDDGRVTVGKSIKVIPETVKKNGSTVPVSWMFYSENATIASVDQKGSVTGKTKGSTYIHAVGTDADGNGYEGKCEVNVYSKITGIKLSASKLAVAPGSSFSLTAKITPSDADFSAVEWSVNVPEGYPGAAYKTNEGTNEEGSFVDIMTDADIKDKLQVTVTATTTDGSNKKASCVITIGKSVTGITLKNGSRELDDKDVIPLNEGKTVSLKAVITPADASNKSVVWSSKDTSVAVVDKNGKVKATGYGICEIIASAADGSGVSRSCIIEVSAPVKSAELSESGTITLGVGMTHEISLARIIPYKCSPYTVEWKSSDEASVEVEGDPLDANWAVITAKKEGNAKITAEITGEGINKKITKTLKVNVAQSQLSAGVVRIFNGKTDISESGLSENRLPVGKKLTLKANAYEKSKDEKALNSGKVKIVWDSSDPDTAAVNNGKLTAYKEGSVTITATVVPTGALGEVIPEPVSTSCDFYIYNPVKKMQLNLFDKNGKKLNDNIKNLTVASGEAFILGASVSVEEAKDGDDVREEKTIDVTSSNDDIVNVSRTIGTFTRLMPMAPGKATITIKTKDGSNKSAKCTITVLGRVESLKITAGKLGNAKVDPATEAEEITVTGLEKNKTFTLSPVINPSKAFNSNVIYRSSNSKVCTVSAKGVVKRCGDGSADIFVTTVDGGKLAVCHVLSL